MDEEDEDEEDEDDEAPSGGKKKAPELLLANKWDLEKGTDPTGWWISEKLDGVRYAYPVAQGLLLLTLEVCQNIL